MNCLPRFRALLPALLLLPALWVATTPARADFTFVHITDTRIGGTDVPGPPATQSADLLREIRARKPAFIINTGSAPLPAEEAGDVRVYNAAGAGQTRSQSWNHGGVHFLLLDSTAPSSGRGRLGPEQLNWLRQDLEKTGRRTPIILGLPHPAGDDWGVVDNTPELLDILRPYNVRLFLAGPGRSDRAWSVGGIPAITTRGLSEGAYHLVEIAKGRIRVLRRTGPFPAVQEVVSAPLGRVAAVSFSADVRVDENGGRVSVTSSGRNRLPEDAVLTFRVNDGPFQAMTREGRGWTGAFPTENLSPGSHTVLVQATLPATHPDTERSYQLLVPVTLAAPSTSP